MAQDEEHGFRSIGNLTAPIANMPKSRGSTQTPSPSSSETSGSPRQGRAPANAIGTQLGAHGAAPRLPAVLAKALAGQDPAETDDQLRTSLPPSVARSLTSVERNWDGPNGFDFERTGWKLTTPVPVNDLCDAYDLVCATLEPCPPRALMAELAHLRAATARRALSEEEEALTFAVLREELAQYPEDVLRSVMRKHARTQRFFPALAEIVGPCEKAVRERRMLRTALDRAQSIKMIADALGGSR